MLQSFADVQKVLSNFKISMMVNGNVLIRFSFIYSEFPDRLSKQQSSISTYHLVFRRFHHIKKGPGPDLARGRGVGTRARAPLLPPSPSQPASIKFPAAGFSFFPP